MIRYVQWVLRSPRRFGHRIVVLIDSRVAVGGTVKGRSGSAALNVLLRRIAALVLAGGLQLYLVFVPSAHNPADPPSRGGPATWPRALREGSRYGVECGERRRRRAAKQSQAIVARTERSLAPLMAQLQNVARAAAVSRRWMCEDSSDSEEQYFGYLIALFILHVHLAGHAHGRGSGHTAPPGSC